MKSGSSRRGADRHDLGRLAGLQSLPCNQEENLAVFVRQPAKRGSNGLLLFVDLGLVRSGHAGHLFAKALAKAHSAGGRAALISDDTARYAEQPESCLRA
jgi:hypothetical protein